MSVFYFTTADGTYYELSATTQVSVSEPARATQNPVESGKSIVDNFVLEPRIITFSGIITDIKVIGQDPNVVKSVDQWISDVRMLRKNKEFVTAYVHSLEAIENCLITNFDLDRDASHGLSGWGCTFQMQETLVSDRARLVDIPVPKQSVADDVSSKRNSGNQTTKENTEVVAVGTLTNIRDIYGFATNEGGDDVDTN